MIAATRRARRRITLGSALALAVATVVAPQALAAGPTPEPIASEQVAPVAGTAPATTVTQRSASGLPLPRPARRSIDAAAVAASMPTGPLARRDLPREAVLGECGRRVYSYFPGTTAVLADFGGGDRINGVDAVKALRAAGFGWDVMKTALSTMGAESDRCPRAIHHNLSSTGSVLSTDYGLWQINTKWHPQFASWDLYDPVANSKAAKQLYDRYGFTPWHGYENRDLYAGWADWAISQAQEAGVR